MHFFSTPSLFWLLALPLASLSLPVVEERGVATTSPSGVDYTLVTLYAGATYVTLYALQNGAFYYISSQDIVPLASTSINHVHVSSGGCYFLDLNYNLATQVTGCNGGDADIGPPRQLLGYACYVCL